jgi:hypothetical protein
LDCRHVCKTCAFHDALRAGKQKEVHPPYCSDLAPAESFSLLLVTGRLCDTGQVLLSHFSKQSAVQYGPWWWPSCNSVLDDLCNKFWQNANLIWYIWYDMINDMIYDMIYDMIRYDMIYDIYMIWYMIYIYMIWYDIYIYIYSTAIGLTPGSSSTVHIYTQTVHRLTPGGSRTAHIYTQTVHRLTPGGSSTAHIYTQTVHRLTPGGSSTVHIYTQNSTHNKQNRTHITNTKLNPHNNKN